MLKNLIRKWLVPDYNEFVQSKNKIDLFMENIAKAQGEMHNLREKEIIFNEPVIFVGSLSACDVQVKPTLKPEIILSKLDFAAALSLSGDYQMVSGSHFNVQPIQTEGNGKK